MKVIKELNKFITPEEITEIYENGHKIAVKYAEKTLLAMENFVTESKGSKSLDEEHDIIVKDCFFLEDGEVFAKENELIVLHSVIASNNIAKCIVAEKDGKVFIMDFCLFDDEAEDFVIDADSVYELK